MSYWKTKVVPKFKKFIEKGKTKKASEVTKSFDKQKETIRKELEEKKTELQPKVVDIYKASTPEAQTVLKNPSEQVVKEHPEQVQHVLQELLKAGFPGADILTAASAKLGVNSISEPVVYLLQKASAFVVDEPSPVKIDVATTSKDIGESSVTTEEAAKEDAALPETTPEPVTAPAAETVAESTITDAVPETVPTEESKTAEEPIKVAVPAASAS